MKIKGIFIFLFLVFFIFYGCKREDKNLETMITEVEEKETELKEVGVPKFLVEEQKYLETNTNIIEEKNTNELFDSETNFLPTKFVKKDTKKNDVIVEEKVKSEVYYEKSSLKKSYVKPKSVSKPKVVGVDKTSPMGLKVYFSYANGKKYIDKRNPGKITSVVYVSREVWYIDFEVYAIPYSYVSKYERKLKTEYLIGIGRNISVVDRRSQLTVYWTGLNLNKKYLPNGKYAIIVKTKHKNHKKNVVSTHTKVLGMSNPIVVILAN